MKSGRNRNSGKKKEVYESKEVAFVFFRAFLVRLPGRFGRLLAVIEERSHFFRSIKSIFLNSISGLCFKAFNWLKISGIVCFLTETNSFTMLNS